MKKNYFNLPIELFKQMLTRHVKLNMAEDDAFLIEEFEFGPDPKERRKIRIIFTVLNLTNTDTVKVQVYKNNSGTSTRNYVFVTTLTIQTNSNGEVKFDFIYDTGVNNSEDGTDYSSDYKFVVEHYNKNDQSTILGSDEVIDNISDYVIFIQYGALASSRRAVKNCQIGLNDKALLQAPTINMFPPTKG